MSNITNNVPQKGQIILSPKTNRPIKVGGSVWRKLVKEGLLEGTYHNPEKICKMKKKRVSFNDKEEYEYDQDEINKDIIKINENLPYNKQAVRGRGHLEGQIVTRNKPPNIEAISKHASRVSSKVILNHMNSINELDDDAIEQELERLILEEMAIPLPTKRTKSIRPRGRPRLSQDVKKSEYSLQETQLYDEDDDEDDEAEDEEEGEVVSEEEY